MDRELAGAIYDVLVAECGALERSRADFLAHWPSSPTFRFAGWLGWGGKITWSGSGAEVDFYRRDAGDPEYSPDADGGWAGRDATVQRRRVMATRANGLIDSLLASHRTVEVPVLEWTDMPWAQLFPEQIDPILALVVEQADRARALFGLGPGSLVRCRIPYRPWREVTYLRGAPALEAWAAEAHIELEVL